MSNLVLPALGKAKAKHDSRTARLEEYMAGMADPPATYLDNLDLMRNCGMMGNDNASDCVVAEDAHTILLQTLLDAVAGSTVISTQQALAFYLAASQGLNGSTLDQGLVMLDYQKWRMRTAWPAPINRQIAGFGTFDPRNRRIMQQLVVASKSVAIGVGLPKTAQGKNTWQLVTRTGDGAPWSWGGHAICIIAYDTLGAWVVTWGGVLYMTYEFMNFYCDEIYARIPTDAPVGFDLTGFINYLKSIGAYYGPDAPPIPPPAPPAPMPSEHYAGELNERRALAAFMWSVMNGGHINFANATTMVYTDPDGTLVQIKRPTGLPDWALPT